MIGDLSDATVYSSKDILQWVKPMVPEAVMDVVRGNVVKLNEKIEMIKSIKKKEEQMDGVCMFVV